MRAEDTFGADEGQPVSLNISGIVLAGEQPKMVLGKGEAVEIVTGAVLPEGADAVVMLEDAEVVDEQLQVYAAVTQNLNVMKKGSDIKTGQKVLRAGQVLGASEIGVLAALGFNQSAMLQTSNGCRSFNRRRSYRTRKTFAAGQNF